VPEEAELDAEVARGEVEQRAGALEQRPRARRLEADSALAPRLARRRVGVLELTLGDAECDRSSCGK
jgi:hypothetical protein